MRYEFNGKSYDLTEAEIERLDEAVEKVEDILEESVKTEPVKKPRTRKPKVSVKEVTEAVEENNEEKSEE